MPTSQSTIDFLLDQLAESGAVTARKMFGEYCLYFAGKPVGLVCDNQLFLKNTQAARALMTEVVEGAPYPGAKPHLCITADQWDDRQDLGHWVRATAHALDDDAAKKPKPVKKPKTVRKGGSGT
jgi:DNA transformation protein